MKFQAYKRMPGNSRTESIKNLLDVKNFSNAITANGQIGKLYLAISLCWTNKVAVKKTALK